MTIQQQTGTPPGAVRAVFHAEVADNSPAREKGLSGRDSLPGDHAMLFVLADAPTAFWMRGMRFPIDILFFDKTMALISVLQWLAPCDRCELHPAPADAAYALEINAGLTDSLGLRPGDVLAIRP